jgi:formiminotetrahydrofolate cyclodeaminase
MPSLQDMSVKEFIAELGSESPAPGGGSVAALCGSLGSALAHMVSNLTLGKDKYKLSWETMEEVRSKAQELSNEFIGLMQEDTDAYNQVVAAFKLPKETSEEKSLRQEAIQNAMKQAAQVPLNSLQAAEKLIHLAKKAVEQGNPNALTDAGAAVHMARSAAEVAAYNVRINLPGIKDENFRAECKKSVDDILARINFLFSQVHEHIDQQLG